MEFIDLKEQYRRYKSEIDTRIQKVLDHGHFIMGPEIAELEQALGVCGEIALAQPRARELGACGLHPRRALPPRELRAELRAIRICRRGRADEHHAHRRWGAGRRPEPLFAKAAGGRDRVEEREQPAPRIADERERLERELARERREILHVRAPGDGGAIVAARPAAAALVVEDEPVLVRQCEHLREHVVVRRARTGVEKGQPGRVWRAERGVKELHAAGADYGRGVGTSVVGHLVADQAEMVERLKAAYLSGRWRVLTRSNGFRP